MYAVRKFFTRHWFLICLLCITILASFLRIYNYQNRWGLAYDQAHDALVARYAIEARKIPLVGPFSSAGAFQTGGEWYWIVMLGTFLFPSAVITPWVFLTVLYVLFVILIVFVGAEFYGKKFGLLVGLLAAVSTAQIAQSTNLTNQSPLALISLFAIWSMVKFVKTREARYLFLLGFNVSFAPTVHMQGILLVSLLVITILFSGIPTFRGFFLLFLGVSIPLVPLLFFDLKSDFINIRNMWSYYFHDQFKISYEMLGRRWLTYAGVFLPTAWGHIIGGNSIAGYLLVGLLWFFTVHDFLKKRIKKDWTIIIASAICMIVIMRYTRTPLFDSYLVVLHPFMLLLSGWAVYKLIRKKMILGLFFLLLIAGGSIKKDIAEILHAENYSAISTTSSLDRLLKKYPQQKFAVYSYQYNWADKNLTLSLFLDAKNLIDDHGRRIGFVVASQSGEFAYPIIMGEKKGYQLLDLQSSSSAQLAKAQWVLVNARQVYEATQEWYTIINKTK